MKWMKFRRVCGWGFHRETADLPCIGQGCCHSRLSGNTHPTPSGPHPNTGISPPSHNERDDQIARPLRTCCLSFLSLRFSFSVLPDFFDATFRGDLSAMSTPFLCWSLPGLLVKLACAEEALLRPSMTRAADCPTAAILA